MDFGDVVVGSSQTRVFIIYNDGDCSLKFRLQVSQTAEGNNAVYDMTMCM